MKLSEFVRESRDILVYFDGISYKTILHFNDAIQYSDGPFHNISGPAIITASGELEYWINGKWLGTNLSNKEFQQKIKEEIFQ